MGKNPKSIFRPQKLPKTIIQPEKKPKTGEDPGSFDSMPIRFLFSAMDKDHPSWGLSQLTAKEYFEVLKFLGGLENNTWNELKKATGGRRVGNNHHSLPIAEFSKLAQERIKELNLHYEADDELFSMRVSQCSRIYGIRHEHS